MTTSVNELIAQVRAQPQTIEFAQVIDTISAHFDYTPTRFTNGRGDDKVVNEAGSNEGSCRIFAFALQQRLTPDETLALFGKFYRDDVLQYPDAKDHGNIRTFMRHGWVGVHFDGVAITSKK